MTSDDETPLPPYHRPKSIARRPYVKNRGRGPRPAPIHKVDGRTERAWDHDRPRPIPIPRPDPSLTVTFTAVAERYPSPQAWLAVASRALFDGDGDAFERARRELGRLGWILTRPT